MAIGKIPRGFLDALKSEIEKNFMPFVENFDIGISLDMPTAAFNSLRKQYDSDIVLEWVPSVSDEKVLAITNYDLYTSSRDLNFIFGQAQCPGRVSLVSLHRLYPPFYNEKPNPCLLLERATKEAIHELGHTFGLDHCSSSRCVMCFSNSIRDVDNKKAAFCKNCRKKLIR